MDSSGAFVASFDAEVTRQLRLRCMIMTRRLVLLAFVVAGLALALAGCGESEEPKITIVEPQPREVPPPPDDYEVELNQVAVIETDSGEIVFELLNETGPKTVRNFVWLANEQHFYDGLTFHRVEADRLIQGGDPLGTGLAGPGYTIENEVNDLHNGPGAVGMAKTSAPNSTGSQFYILLSDWSHLDGKFCVFGNVIKGLDAVREISHVKVHEEYAKPMVPVYMRKVRVVDRGSLDL